ncbi:MAG: endonuclease III [Candidatus Aenigmarchaeota archaeon]|nr:endonuclease III [Candidatus Aenigmarchaeota archaeon]
MQEQKIKKMISLLSKGQGKTMLGSIGEKKNAFKVLISTVLSARTKDSTTIPIAQKLFRKYKNPEDFLKAPLKQLEKEIYGIGFYRVKASRLKQLCKILIEKYHGIVPQTMEQLLELPGVGRKTANCVLVYAFRKPAIPVDVHVHRISNRLGLVKTEKPEETEMRLMEIVPRKYWIDVNELLVRHGQTICLPQSPFCSRCPVFDLCDRNGVTRSR